MRSAMKTLLAFALVLATVSGAWAQAAGNWQKIHGQVQSVQGNQLVIKTDDGRLVNVDISQVSASVRGAMTPNLGVTVTGFPGAAVERFTARYIEQDNAGPAPAASVATGDPNAVINRVAPLVPMFVSSQEFQSQAAGFNNDRRAAERLVTRLYRGFFEREPSEQDRQYWVNHLMQTRDVQGTVESFLKSPEYVSMKKSEPQAISDLYQAVFGRTPTPDEVRSWQQRIAQK